MDSQRNLLLIALLFVSFMIWQAWQVDNNPQPAAQTTQQTANTATGDKASQAVPGSGQGQLITVKTDVLSLTINTRGGDIEQANLLAYPDALGSDKTFELLETTPAFIYQAQSGLTGKSGPDNPANGERPLFEVPQTSFVLADGQDELRIPLTFTGKDGSVFTKTFVLKRNDYAIGVDYHIKNASAAPLELTLFGQLKQSINLPKHRDTGSNNFALHTYRGAAYSSDETKYKNIALVISKIRAWTSPPKAAGLRCCSNILQPRGSQQLTKPTPSIPLTWVTVWLPSALKVHRSLFSQVSRNNWVPPCGLAQKFRTKWPLSRHILT